MRVDVSDGRAGAAGAAAAVAAIAVRVSISHAMEGDRRMTYSPPLTLLVPKLLPTVPVQRHVSPAEFFHVAVAVAPIFRQVMERFSRGSTGEPKARAAKASDVRSSNFMMNSRPSEFCAQNREINVEIRLLTL